MQGDSGGPLITQRKDKLYELVGIVSWGKKCRLIFFRSHFSIFFFQLRFSLFLKVTDVLDQIIQAFTHESRDTWIGLEPMHETVVSAQTEMENKSQKRFALSHFTDFPR